MDERDGEFLKALGEAWNFIKGDGSFTGNELKRWSNTLDSDLSRQVLRAIIQTAWNDYGGKTHERRLNEFQTSLIQTLWQLAQARIDDLYESAGAEEEKQAVEAWMKRVFPADCDNWVRDESIRGKRAKDVY